MVTLTHLRARKPNRRPGVFPYTPATPAQLSEWQEGIAKAALILTNAGNTAADVREVADGDPVFLALAAAMDRPPVPS